MLSRIRNAIFGPPHIPTPGTLAVDGTPLLLSCDDTSETGRTRVNGELLIYPYTMWTGGTHCELVSGELDFLVFCESPTPRECDLALIREIVAYPRSIKSEIQNAVFDFFETLRTQHSVDFSTVLQNWSFDSVIQTLDPPTLMIDSLDDNTPRRNSFLISFSSDLDPEHGVDVLICDWKVIECGCLV